MKIAIFGGAFDPLHKEHVLLVHAVSKQLQPNKMIIVPTAEPPHKKSLLASFQDRVAMLRASFSGEFEVTEIEQTLGGKNYSVNLVKALKKEYPQAEILFVLGSDSLRDLKLWKNPEELSTLVTFVSVPRGDKNDWEESARYAQEHFGATVITANYHGKDVSSSVLKGKLLLGEDVDGEVPAPALQYLQENGLYQKYSDILGKLKDSISPKLYHHAVNTTLFALRFCAHLALPFEDVFLACMFHDAAKEDAFFKLNGVPNPIAHQFYGAEVARHVYGIENESVLNAIKFHTSGKADMTKLEKLVYAADKLEESRSYQGAERLRAELLLDFDSGFKNLVKQNYQYQKDQNAEIFFLQNDCYQHYIKE